MSRLLVQESFVNQILAPHLYARGYLSVSARLLGNARQRSRRGGIKNWDLVREGILRHLKQDRGVLATTMVDYYRLPHTWPGRSDAPSRAFRERASTVERELADDVSAKMGGSFDSRRFVPYVVMHEFEGLLFSDPSGFGWGIGRSDLSPSIGAIRDAFGTPEEINDSPCTAPSKRIEDLMPRYQKPLHGLQAAQESVSTSSAGNARSFQIGCIGWSSGSVSSLLNPSRIDRGRLPLARRVVSMLGFAFQIFREEGCAVSLPCRSRVVI